MPSFIRPEFFDLFGIAVFLFITIESVRAIKTKKRIPRWVFVLLLVIGILGLLIDGTIVYKTYFL
ncbi:MAG: hypothetical protein Q7R98_02790 [Candidatus Jorgensenbacteria bacterium]|nr:hypothetical protein [Candidatus Jorgensenbacteria bacterium]